VPVFSFCLHRPHFLLHILSHTRSRSPVQLVVAHWSLLSFSPVTDHEPPTISQFNSGVAGAGSDGGTAQAPSLVRTLSSASLEQKHDTGDDSPLAGLFRSNRGMSVDLHRRRTSMDEFSLTDIELLAANFPDNFDLDDDHNLGLQYSLTPTHDTGATAMGSSHLGMSSLLATTGIAGMSSIQLDGRVARAPRLPPPLLYSDSLAVTGGDLLTDSEFTPARPPVRSDRSSVGPSTPLLNERRLGHRRALSFVGGGSKVWLVATTLPMALLGERVRLVD
jgi:hypothetical protein